MLNKLQVTCALVVAAILATLVVATGTASAKVVHDTVVATTPSARTPQILDASTSLREKVLDLEEVGSRILVGGIFGRVRDASANGGGTFDRSYVFAFDSATGAVDRGFAPV